MSDLSAQERAIIIRSHLSSPGWLMESAALQEKYDLVAGQALLPPEERHADYKTWSVDRIGGMALGLGYARKFLQLWLDKFDKHERAAQEANSEPEPMGHPYAEEPVR